MESWGKKGLSKEGMRIQGKSEYVEEAHHKKDV